MLFDTRFLIGVAVGLALYWGVRKWKSRNAG